MFYQVTSSWSLAWPRREFRIELILSIIFLAFVLSFFAHFVNWVEMRNGVTFIDPILSVLAPRDVTWLIFALIYISLIVALGALALFPEQMVLAIQAYAAMVIFRTAVMFMVPLDAPPEIIPLKDPLVEMFGTGTILTRDLFFSGHTATIFILFLCVPQRRLKIILLVNTFVLAACLLLQHVHYSIDVFAAPFFSYGAYRTVLVLRHLINPNPKIS